jgi:preprotein translocase subunit SecY
MVGAQGTHIPLKLAMAGVMPVILWHFQQW